MGLKKVLTSAQLEGIKNSIGDKTRPAKGLFEGWMKPDDPDAGKTFVLGGVKPSREHIQTHDFAEWVMRAHKDAIYAVNELEAVATHYGAGDVRMAGVASAKQAIADVTVIELIEHLRQFFPITLGRAAAAQHADRGSTKQPIGDGPCGCIVRK